MIRWPNWFDTDSNTIADGPIRVVLADDHGIVRAGLRALLNNQPDIRVVGEAADGPTAVQVTLEQKPSVVISDLSMPGEGSKRFAPSPNSGCRHGCWC